MKTHPRRVSRFLYLDRANHAFLFSLYPYLLAVVSFFIFRMTYGPEFHFKNAWLFFAFSGVGMGLGSMALVERTENPKTAIAAIVLSGTFLQICFYRWLLA